jgi:predicted MFS family arabinose efflux permease
MLPLRIVTHRNRGGSYLLFVFLGAGLFAMFLFLTYYFQVNLGYSPLKAGFAFLPFSLGVIFAAAAVAQALPRIGPRPLMVGGMAMAIVGMLMLTRITQDSSYWSYVFPSEVIMSVGLAAVFIPASSTALIGIGHHDAGVASATLNTSQQIGGSLGTALLNTVFAGATTAYLTDNLTNPADMPKVLPLAFIHGYHVAFWWGAALYLVSFLIAVFIVNATVRDLPADPMAVGNT